MGSLFKQVGTPLQFPNLRNRSTSIRVRLLLLVGRRRHALLPAVRRRAEVVGVAAAPAVGEGLADPRPVVVEEPAHVVPAGAGVLVHGAGEAGVD